MSEHNKTAASFLDKEFRNYLNLGKISKDAFIYRIFPLNRFYEMFEEQKNTLVAPKLWDDPYENYVLQSHVALPTGEYYGFGFKDSYFGQCWTQRTYSDAMWRIYSPDARSVRVRTTINKLANSLVAQNPKMKNDTCFIGKVKYQGNANLTKFSNEVATMQPSSSLYAETLLRKRNAFSHEKEVRLIFMDTESKSEGNIYKYNISTHDLFDQIMIDPRTCKEDFIDIKNAILRRTKFSGEITRSSLYDPPPKLIHIK